jgi:hypothetical protein
LFSDFNESAYPLVAEGIVAVARNGGLGQKRSFLSSLRGLSIRLGLVVFPGSAMAGNPGDKTKSSASRFSIIMSAEQSLRPCRRSVLSRTFALGARRLAAAGEFDLIVGNPPWVK